MSRITRIKSYLGEKSPSILTGLAVVGILTTTYLAVKSTPKALEAINEAKSNLKGSSEEEVQLRPVDYVRICWPFYVSTGLMMSATITCIVGSNAISKKRQVALIGAYSLTETAFREYREKVAEQFGKNKEQKVRDEVAKDRVDKHASREIVILADGNVHCFDDFTGRSFMSNAEKIRKAENDINRQCINEMYASQNDFYRLIGLKPVDVGERVGWTTDNPLEIIFVSTLVEDKPVLAIKYRLDPTPNFHKVW